MPLNAPNLCLVSIDTIYEPIAAIPHEGGLIGDFLFIWPADNWGYGFTQLIEDNEPNQDNSDSDSISGSDTESSQGDSESTIRTWRVLISKIIINNLLITFNMFP